MSNFEFIHTNTPCVAKLCYVRSSDVELGNFGEEKKPKQVWLLFISILTSFFVHTRARVRKCSELSSGAHLEG